MATLMRRTLMTLSALVALSLAGAGAAGAQEENPRQVNCGTVSVVCADEILEIGTLLDVGGLHFGG